MPAGILFVTLEYVGVEDVSSAPAIGGVLKKGECVLEAYLNGTSGCDCGEQRTSRRVGLVKWSSEIARRLLMLVLVLVLIRSMSCKSQEVLNADHVSMSFCGAVLLSQSFLKN